MPEPLEAVARVLPLTNAVAGLGDVLVKGAALDSPALQLDLAVLGLTVLVLVALATLTIRRELA